MVYLYKYWENICKLSYENHDSPFFFKKKKEKQKKKIKNSIWNCLAE